MGHDRINQFEERAEEIRSCAENMRNPSAKADLLCIAECYDRMADREKAAYAASSSLLAALVHPKSASWPS